MTRVDANLQWESHLSGCNFNLPTSQNSYLNFYPKWMYFEFVARATSYFVKTAILLVVLRASAGRVDQFNCIILSYFWSNLLLIHIFLNGSRWCFCWGWKEAWFGNMENRGLKFYFFFYVHLNSNFHSFRFEIWSICLPVTPYRKFTDNSALNCHLYEKRSKGY